MTVYFTPGPLDALRLRATLPHDLIRTSAFTPGTLADDLEQVALSDVLVVRTTDPQAGVLLGWWLHHCTGGIERTVLVGTRSIPWHWHPQIEAHATWLDFITDELSHHAVA